MGNKFYLLNSISNRAIISINFIYNSFCISFLIFLASCSTNEKLEIDLKDNDVKKLYLYKNIALYEVVDSASAVNNKFVFNTKLLAHDLYFISDKTPSSLTMGKYFGQIIKSKGSQKMELLKDLKYLVFDTENIKLKTIYDNHENLMNDSVYIEKTMTSMSKSLASPFLLYYLKSLDVISN